MDPSLCLICSFAGPGLHRFPRDKKRLRQWLVAIKRTDLLENEHGSSIVYNSGRVCNAHFANSCFSGKDKKKLAKHAVPSLPVAVLEQSAITEKARECNIAQGDNKDVSGKKLCVTSESSVILESPSIETEHKDEISQSQPEAFEQKSKDATYSMEKIVEENILYAVNSTKVPENIIGATNTTGELLLLVKWKGVNEADLLPSTFVRKHFPELLIQFYEERLVWSPTNEDKSVTTES